MREETVDYQTSDVRLALCLEPYYSFTVGHIEVGYFGAPLRCARNDIGGRCAARFQRFQMVQRAVGVSGA